MTDTHDAQLLEMFIRVPPESRAQQSVPCDAVCEIDLHAEAGIAVLAMQLGYKLLVTVRDVTDGTTVTTLRREGFLGDEQWPRQFVWHPFRLAPQGRAKQDHIYEAMAALVVGPTPPIVDFLESRFILV